MKRFAIITEADARGLDIGSTVSLASGGHVTPLASDTLRARRIEVIRDGTVSTGATLVPVEDIRRIAIGSDHSGIVLKGVLCTDLRGRGLAVNDVGTHTADPVDYPDIAAAVAQLVAAGEVDAGIVIDGAGLGSAMAANKVDGIRAAMCNDETLARYAREHNGANVLALGASLISPPTAIAIVQRWLTTPMREPRYIARLSKLQRLERQGAPKR